MASFKITVFGFTMMNFGETSKVAPACSKFHTSTGSILEKFIYESAPNVIARLFVAFQTYSIDRQWSNWLGDRMHK